MFKKTKDTFEKNDNDSIKLQRYEYGPYIVTFQYYGNYIEDKKNDVIHKKNIIVDVQTTPGFIPIRCTKNVDWPFVIAVNHGEYILPITTERSYQEYVRYLELAHECIPELNQIYHELYG